MWKTNHHCYAVGLWWNLASSFFFSIIRARERIITGRYWQILLQVRLCAIDATVCHRELVPTTRDNQLPRLRDWIFEGLTPFLMCHDRIPCADVHRTPRRSPRCPSAPVPTCARRTQPDRRPRWMSAVRILWRKALSLDTGTRWHPTSPWSWTRRATTTSTGRRRTRIWNTRQILNLIRPLRWEHICAACQSSKLFFYFTQLLLCNKV